MKRCPIAAKIALIDWNSVVLCFKRLVHIWASLNHTLYTCTTLTYFPVKKRGDRRRTDFEADLRPETMAETFLLASN